MERTHYYMECTHSAFKENLKGVLIWIFTLH